MLALAPGGAGLDQPKLGLEWALGKSRREATGQTPSCRQIAAIQGRLGGMLQCVVSPGIVGIGRNHPLEPCLGFFQSILLEKNLGDSIVQRRQQRRLWKALERRVERGHRGIWFFALELDRRQLQGGSGSLGDGRGRQGSQQWFGLRRAIESNKSQRALKLGLTHERAARHGSLERAERGDGFLELSGRFADQTDLQPGPVDPFGLRLLDELLQHDLRAAPFSERRQRPPQAIFRSFGKLSLRMCRQRPLVRQPRARKVLEPEAGVAQIGPRHFQTRVVGSRRGEFLQRRP